MKGVLSMKRTTLVKGISAVGVLIVIVGWLVVVGLVIVDWDFLIGFGVMLAGLTLAIVPLAIDLLWCLWIGRVER